MNLAEVEMINLTEGEVEVTKPAEAVVEMTQQTGVEVETIKLAEVEVEVIKPAKVEEETNQMSEVVVETISLAEDEVGMIKPAEVEVGMISLAEAEEDVMISTTEGQETGVMQIAKSLVVSVMVEIGEEIMIDFQTKMI